MNNNEEDYLWDQTGEPDPEIQELEQLLGTLRYQPRPLKIPEGLKPGRQGFSLHDFKPYLAIAAAIALIVLGAGLWLSFERRDTSKQAKTEPNPSATDNSNRAAVTVTEDLVEEVPNSEKERLEEPVAAPSKPLNRTHRNRLHQSSIAANTHPKRAVDLKTPGLGADELKEAEAGKAQLMLALRVASTKLNLAIKKTQGTNNGNLIHNQHKVG